MAVLVAGTELAGGILLVLGAGARLAALALTTVMLTALATAHPESLRSLTAFTEQPPYPFLVATLIVLAFGAGGFDANLLGLANQHANQASELDRFDSLQPELSRLQEALARHLSDDAVRMSRTRTELRVALNDNVLFAPGSTELHPAAYSLLTDIGGALAGEDLHVSVQGHTDNTGDQWRNWELSAMRAVAVVTVLQERGHLDGRMLELRGYGQYEPAAVAGTVDSSWDRRVELVVQTDRPKSYNTLERISRMTGGADGR